MTAFFELLAQLGERLDSNDPAAVMDESALADFERLRLLAQPAIPGRHTVEENLLIAITELAAGDFHLRRWGYLMKTGPHSAAASELYRALLAFRSVLEDPSRLPPEWPFEQRLSPLVKQLFGPDANGEVQGNIAYFLLANAPPDADRDFHAVAIDLLRTAVDGIPHDHPNRHEWLRVLRMADQPRRPPGLDWMRIRTNELGRWLFSAGGPDPPGSQELALTDWNEVTGRFSERLSESVATSRPELLGESASSDAAALVRALRSLGPQGFGSQEERRRLADAYYLLGSFHNLRAAFGTFGDTYADLARAVLFLSWIDFGEDQLPHPVGRLLGRGADPEVRTHYAAVFLEQAETTPDPALIAASVVLLVDAITSVPANAPEQAGYLGNMAAAYGIRYQRNGARGDLDQAIACAERSLALTLPDDPNLARRHSRIGVLYDYLTRHTRLTADHDRALQALESAVAVAAASDSDPDLAGHLMNLGAAYAARPRLPQRRADADADADLADLSRAIDLTERALAVSTVREVSIEASYNLGVDYRNRYQITDNPADLARAVEVHEWNLATLEADDPSRLKSLSHLAIAYEERFTADRVRVSPEVLRNLTRQIDALEDATPVHRVWACRNVGSLADAMGDHATATDLMGKAVRLLQLVIDPEGDWEDREQRVGEHLGLVDKAIATYCRAGDPQGAVEMAERGRGIILPVLAGVQSDLTALEDQHPDLAARFHQLRDTLNRPHGALIGDTRSQLLGNRPYQVAERLLWQSQYDELVNRIRLLPEFADFLLPAEPGALRSAAEGGAVVLVNADWRGGDAVVVTAEGDPVHIPLPNLKPADVQAYGLNLLHAAHFRDDPADPLSRRRVLLQVLRWLWISIVEPVLTALPSQPRIWWMPSGVLALFPLHAAGVPGQPDALDLAVSSYTSTLRALASTRIRPPASVRRQLTVILEQTEGLPRLPGVVKEAEALHAAYPDAPHLRDGKATIARVMSALLDATWAHFSCHATADFLAPSRGGLRLHDGVLTVPDISRLHLRHAEFAYLSACSTANPGVRLANESITLASAFQMVGFRHVVASLWPLQDEAAAMVARAFYDRMPDTPTADGAAQALRQVAIEFRSAHPDRPDLWAPLIHFGP